MFLELLSPRGDPLRCSQFHSLLYIGQKALPVLCDVLAGRLDSQPNPNPDQIKVNQKFLERLLVLESALMEDLEKSINGPPEDIDLGYLETTFLLVKKVDPKHNNKQLSLGAIKLLSKIQGCSKGFGWLKRKISSQSSILLDIMKKHQKRKNLLYSSCLEILKIHYQKPEFHIPLKQNFGEYLSELEKGDHLIVGYERQSQGNLEKELDSKFSNNMESAYEDQIHDLKIMPGESLDDEIRREKNQDFLELEKFRDEINVERQRQRDQAQEEIYLKKEKPDKEPYQKEELADDPENDIMKDEEENEAKNSLKMLLSSLRKKKTMHDDDDDDFGGEFFGQKSDNDYFFGFERPKDSLDLSDDEDKEPKTIEFKFTSLEKAKTDSSGDGEEESNGKKNTKKETEEKDHKNLNNTEESLGKRKQPETQNLDEIEPEKRLKSE